MRRNPKRMLAYLAVVSGACLSSVWGVSWMVRMPEATWIASDEDVCAPVCVEFGDERVGNFPKTVCVETGSKRHVVEFTGKLDRTKLLLIASLPTYEIAAYSEAPKHGPSEELLDGMLVDGSCRVLLLRFKTTLPGRAIVHDINSEIQGSFGDVDTPRLKSNIERFVGQFGRGSSKGDLVYFVWLPGGRVYTSFNSPDKVHFISEDESLARAIWRIWCGPQSGPERVRLVERYAGDASMRR